MQSLALKYRPNSFADIVGQKMFTQSVQNSLRSNKMHHAYLFFGARGVGKTSAARILAKSLNCTNRNDTEFCNHCDNCILITVGNHPDVLEMDAASNRGIDHIRHIRENIKFAPMQSQYKVYIIDEVHMLTNEAFNALLKTLEEPPKHIIFILATTEKHKIPETILSRCQIFPFHKFSIDEMKQRLTYIIQKEDISIDIDVLPIIIYQAEGSMRDVLSLLDQMLTYSGDKTITIEMAYIVLGLTNFNTYVNLLDAIHKRNIKQALFSIEQVYQEGYNLKQFIWDFLNIIKNIYLIKKEVLTNQSSMLPQSYFETLQTMTEYWDIHELYSLFEELYKFYNGWIEMQMSKSSEAKIAVEIILIKIITKLEQPSVAQLTHNIMQLKHSLEAQTSISQKTIEKPQEALEQPTTAHSIKKAPVPVDSLVSPQTTKNTDVGTILKRDLLTDNQSKVDSEFNSLFN